MPPGELITAPVIFKLSGDQGKEVLKFLRAVAHTVLELRTPTRLNFRNTKVFQPDATILLFAELDRLVTLSVLDKPLTVMNPIQRRPREVLKQIGIHEITGDTCNTVPSRADVVYWKSTKGKDQSGTNLAVLEVVAERVNNDHATQIELSGIWRGVSEAVANSVEHAYKFPRQDGFSGLPETKWWMFTQLRDATFTVAVCDLGCGYGATIAHTIPELFLAEVRRVVFSQNKDAFAINTAMAYGRSGTKQTERGKGSRDAFSVVQGHGEGTLLIISNTGYVEYTFKGGELAKTLDGNLEIDMKGTIVMWKLPLEAK